MSRRARNFCWTLNNPTQRATQTIKDNATAFKYIVFGREVGEQGTPHLQGYVEFSTVKSFGQVKALIDPRIHVEVAKGNSLQNREYCTKQDEDPFEAGSRSTTSAEKGKRERERWEDAWRLAKEGRFDDIDPDIRVRSYSTLKTIRKDYMVQAADLDAIDARWFLGPPGSGKSHHARVVGGEAGGYYEKACNKWWDGYQDQPVVIIDDLDMHRKALGHDLKIWADKYSFTAEIKCGALSIRPKTIIVTANYSIRELWGDDPALVEALERRFTVTHFGRDRHLHAQPQESDNAL